MGDAKGRCLAQAAILYSNEMGSKKRRNRHAISQIGARPRGQGEPATRSPYAAARQGGHPPDRLLRSRSRSRSRAAAWGSRKAQPIATVSNSVATGRASGMPVGASMAIAGSDGALMQAVRIARQPMVRRRRSSEAFERGAEAPLKWMVNGQGDQGGQGGQWARGRGSDRSSAVRRPADEGPGMGLSPAPIIAPGRRGAKGFEGAICWTDDANPALLQHFLAA